MSRSPNAQPQKPTDDCSLVIKRTPGNALVTVHGELDEGGCQLLATILTDLTGDQGNRAVAVDLAQATVGPTTATVLTAAACRARQLGAKFIVKEPSRQIVEALASREWGELIEILPRADSR